jgi:Tol biopolymer transport system component
MSFTRSELPLARVSNFGHGGCFLRAVRAGRRATLAAILIAALVGAPNAGAAFPGQNGPLVFGARHGLYTINPDGTHREQIAERGVEPAVAPDGLELTFRSFRCHVYTMGMDGNGRKRVDDCGFNPSFSPDGDSIIFGGRGIRTVNADGSNEVRFAHTGRTADCPRYSPDGQSIAFWQSRNNQRTPLFLMDADGGHKRKIAHTSSQVSCPAFSLHGKEIAFAHENYFRCGITQPLNWATDLVVMSRNEHHRRTLVKGGHDVLLDPVFSPNGKKIAFAAHRMKPPGRCGDGWTWDLEVMRTDGTHLRVVKRNLHGVFGLDWAVRR